MYCSFKASVLNLITVGYFCVEEFKSKCKINNNWQKLTILGASTEYTYLNGIYLRDINCRANRQTFDLLDKSFRMEHGHHK